MKSSPLERFVHQYEMDRESENEHSQVGDADRLADILLKYLSPVLALKIMKEYF